MARNLTLSQELALAALLAQSNLVGGATGGYVDVQHAKQFSVLVKLQAAPGGATHTIQLKQATSAAGAGSKALGDAVEVEVAAGVVPDDVVLDMLRTDLDTDNGFFFVGITVTAVLDEDGGDPEVCLIAPQDVGTVDVTGTYVDVTGWKSFAILSKAGAVTAAKILTAQLMAAEDAIGTEDEAVGDPATAAGAGGAAPADIVQSMDVADLPDGKPFVTVVLGIDEAAKLGTATLVRTDRGTFGSAWVVLGDRRYKP